MKKILILVFVLIAGVGYGQVEVTSGTIPDLPYFTGYIGKPENGVSFNIILNEHNSEYIGLKVGLNDIQWNEFINPTKEYFYFTVYDENNNIGVEYRIVKLDTTDSLVFVYGDKTIEGVFKIEELVDDESNIKIVQLVPARYTQVEVPSFEGYVGAPTEETDNLFKRFNDFMLEKEGNTIYLDITLDETQHDAFKTPTDDFYFFAVYDYYSDNMSGIEYHFIKSKTPVSYAFNTEKNTIEGYFKITGITGPQNGLLIVELIAVKKISG